MTPEEIERYKPLLIELLPLDGSKGNTTLIPEFLKNARSRFAINLTESDYWEVRNALLTAGVIGKGRGRGGSIYRILPAEEKFRPARKSEESDLYQPVYGVIKDTWVKENDIGQDFIIQLTASQGKRRTGGKWTRPDVSLVAVRTYPYIPGKILEVITFEIKNENEYGIEGVFETAAHSVFAHRSYLTIYLPDGRPKADGDFDRLERMCEQFGVGLLNFRKPERLGHRR